MGLPFTIIRNALFLHLKSITAIRGTLIFKEMNSIFALNFMDNLVSADKIVLINNPQLVDARLASLTSLPGGVEVLGCHRLCPARYTSTNRSVVNDSHCPQANTDLFYTVVGDVDRADLSVLEGLAAKWFSNVSNGVVSFIVIFISFLSHRS
jgi:hypothetical protein